MFYAPAAFTPDGDGLNDAFAPSVRGAREYELVVYDRWGTERFRSTGQRPKWAAMACLKVSTRTPRGSLSSVRSARFSGHVTLLR
ncbi:MAG: gliding motility-associated C-terminal domain-containing protein [Flavobacteriales bacterium]